MNILFLITARGGSKGVPGKNLREIGGLSLIGFKARSARQSRHCGEPLASEASRARTARPRPGRLSATVGGALTWTTDAIGPRVWLPDASSAHLCKRIGDDGIADLRKAAHNSRIRQSLDP